MNRALLDTDILSEIGKGIDPVLARNATHYRSFFGRYTISAITVMEVVGGFARKQSPGRIQTFLASIAGEDVVGFDGATAELAGKIGGQLFRIGQTIGLADTMIAAIAVHHGLELVTGNPRHFERVQQLGYPLTSLSPIGVSSRPRLVKHPQTPS